MAQGNCDVPYTKTEVDTKLSSKADLASPALTGNPTAPTQASGNNSTRLASTAFVAQEITARFKNFRQVTVTDTLAAYVNAIKNYSTADILLIDVGSTIASAIIGSTTSLGGITIVYKASSSNAYFFFFNRDKCVIGNVSLTNTEVNVRHVIV